MATKKTKIANTAKQAINLGKKLAGELNTLTGNINKLAEFLNTHDKSNIIGGFRHLQLLKKQHKLMTDYAKTLEQRIQHIAKINEA